VGAPVDYHGLKRIRHAAPQQSLDAAARRRNQLGAYRACGDFLEKNIAIVDDVMTTGATAAEVATTLIDAGAANVYIWAAARTLAT
jgi:predicted amidophosphoribosyltransferase